MTEFYVNYSKERLKNNKYRFKTNITPIRINIMISVDIFLIEYFIKFSM